MKNKVCHLTSVHSRYDTRIFYKECCSLQKAGYQVTLLVSDDKPSEIKEGIEIYSIKYYQSRILRILLAPWQLIFQAVIIKADVYHFHDPELIIAGLCLKRFFNKKIIFDIHENIEQQMQTKYWLPDILRLPIAAFYRILIPIVCKEFQLVLAELSYIKDYEKFKPSYEVILNKPILKKLMNFRMIKRNKKTIFYVGKISEERGFDIFLQVIQELDKQVSGLEYHLVGTIELMKSNLTEYKELQNVHFYGKLPWLEAYEISKECGIGISILKPTGNYLNSYSTKIFEYMAIQLPFIVSDFKIYDDTVKEPQNGLLVDPLNVSDIVEKMLLLIRNKQIYAEIQSNQKKFIELFNWSQEEIKLVSFYEKIISKN